VTGSGRADKAQVTRMVTRLLRMADPPRPADTADALALAICHLWRGGAQQRMKAQQQAARQRMAAAAKGGPGAALTPGGTR
jgi:crossover junction endodeoxyribonuclease RuvC